MTKAESAQKYRRSKPPEWSVWCGMKERCSNPNHKFYEYYGGKGVEVCARWREYGKGFYNFLDDMGSRPSPIYELDRVDPAKTYEKDNCRWLLAFENNSRAHTKAKGNDGQ